MARHGQNWPAALGMTAILLMLHAAAPAHERKAAGGIRLTIGWGDEPAFSGFKNSVVVDLADAAGAPVTELDGPLAAEVSFGDQRTVLALLPAGERPGEYRAWLVPTRAGTYTFHITGKAKGQPIDATSTCSDKTFDCVVDVSDIQFPAKDPSAGELALRVSRVLPRTEQARDAAGSARNVAIAAIAVAALALAGALGLGLRRGGKGV
jgi:hypothetical protein